MKIIDKIKEYLAKGITIKPKVAIITAVVSAVSMCVSYAGGGIYKLDNLVMQEAQSQIEELKQSDNEITSEIKELSDKKENLNNTLNKNKVLELIEIAGDSRKYLVRNFMSGISKGIGIGIGFSIITALIIYVMQKIIRLNIPVLSQYISDIVEIVERTK